MLPPMCSFEALRKLASKMKLRPDTLALTMLLAVLTSLGPLSTDMYLPSLPNIGDYFHRTAPDVQMTLSAFLIGFAAGQIIYGPLSDKHGRKPVLLGGLALFTLATIACALATNLEMLIVARFFQALGASGPIVLARSMVRDLYALDRAGRELARMGMYMGLVPAIAPVLGGLVEDMAGWRANFWLISLCAVATTAMVVLTLPETLKQKSAAPLSFGRILRTYGELLGHAGFRAYIALVCCTYGGLFAYLSGVSFVLQKIYGLSPRAFGFAFGIGVAGYILGTILAQRLISRLGIEGTIRLGVVGMAAGGVLMLVATLFGPGHYLEVMLPMAVYLCGVGLALPQTQAGAMMPFPHKAGAASSLLGLSQMSFAAVFGIGIGHAVEKGAWPLGAGVALMGLGALAAFYLFRPAREAMLRSVHS